MPEKDPRVTETLKEVLETLETPAVVEKAQEIDMDKVMAEAGETMKKFRGQMDEYCKRLGLSREELKAYSSDPKNFTKEDWALLEKIRMKLEESGGPPAHEEEPPEEGDLRKGVEKKPVKKKRKGSKKRDWIQG